MKQINERRLTKMAVNKGITLSDDVAAKIQAWADSPTERRSFSNAIEVLCMKALEAMEEKKN